MIRPPFPPVGPCLILLPLEEEALAVQAALRAAAIPPPRPPPQSVATEQPDQDPDSTSIAPSVQGANASSKVVKKVAKKKLTAKEKRERGVTIHLLSLTRFLVSIKETVGD